MPYDPAQCLDKLNSAGLTPACQQLEPPYLCDSIPDLNPNVHNLCVNAGTPYFPIVVVVCQNTQTGEARYFTSNTVIQQCMALAQQDPNWELAQCYCCCTGGPANMTVAVPEGTVAIDTVQTGASVLAASAMQSGGGLQLKWSEAKVNFSQGTGVGGQQPTVISVTFGADGNQKLFCSADQPFLLSNGKLATGGNLRPGQQLVDRDGQPQEIKQVCIEAYEGGFHYIATDEPWTGSPDGHLLLAGGVVIGDYTLQLHFGSLPDSMKEE